VHLDDTHSSESFLKDFSDQIVGLCGHDTHIDAPDHNGVALRKGVNEVEARLEFKFTHLNAE
jgi:hypothetical protein